VQGFLSYAALPFLQQALTSEVVFIGMQPAHAFTTLVTLGLA